MHHLASIFLSLTMIIGGSVSPAFAGEKVTDYDRFNLWNECKPIFLLVGGLPDKAAEIGLTRDDIQTSVRSRLRGARIYRHSVILDHLYVRVNVVGAAFSVELNFQKWLRDTNLSKNGSATTWDTGATGTHGNDASYILGAVSQYTDEFIDEYLRVNADACK